MGTPAVSICVLAYNRPEGLRRTLAYWRAQAFTDWELLIGDDASTDVAVETVGRAAAASDSRIRYFRQEENRGIVANHQFLLAKARGTYLVWACDDDHWHPGYLAAAVAVLAGDPEVVMVCGKARILLPDGTSLPQPSQLDTRGLPRSARFVRVAKHALWWNHEWYGVFRRAALDQVSLSSRFAFDILAVAELSLQGSFACLPETYFCKTAGGVGNQLASNLASIRARSHWLLRRWPSASVFGGLVARLWQAPALSWRVRLQDTLGLIPVLWRLPFGRPRWFRQGRAWLRQLKTSLAHRLWRAYARLRFHEPLRTSLQQFPWVKPPWVHATGDGAWLAPLGVEVDLPTQDFAFNHFFALREFVDRGGALKRLPTGELGLHWQGLQLALRSGMDIEVVKEVMGRGTYDLRLPPGSVVLDVGMNVGITSLWLARLPEVAKVYGYEPIPALRAQAQQQFALNPGLGAKIEARPFGLAAVARQARFSYAATYGVYASEFFPSPATEATQLEVSLGGVIDELTRLTNLHPQASLVMKLDGEGCEYELIPQLAATGWLARLHLVMLEWHQRGPEALLAHFQEAGFLVVSRPADKSRGMLYALAPGLHPLPLFEATQHAGY